MKVFQFKKFNIGQRADVFRVGTDGVVLGALANVDNITSVLEVGTGTGLIALMIAQRNFAVNVLALDINRDAADLAQFNFSQSVFSERLKSKFMDFKNFETTEKFDLIISNPPFFEVNDSQKDAVARQKIELDFSEIISKSVQLLSEKGRLSVIIPKQDEVEFVNLASIKGLFLQRKINVKGIVDGDVKRVILEFGFQNESLQKEDFIIEQSPRVYTDQYLEATKDFHVFKTKTP